MLDQKPFFAAYLYDHFDFATQAWATRIGNEASEKLGGERIGPYRIAAKQKGENGEFDIYIVIDCTTTFFDIKGRETNDLKKAYSVKEIFDSIEIEPRKK